MKVVFGVSKKHNIALLLKSSLVSNDNKAELSANYLIPMSKVSNIPMGNDMCVLPAYHPQKGNLKKADLVTSCNEILEYCDVQGIETLVVGDSKYFEYLTGVKGLERQIGQVFDCVHDYDIKVLPVLNYKALEMSPDKKPLQDRAFEVVAATIKGEEVKDKASFKFKDYRVLTHPSQLDELLQHDILAIDIETTGLRFESNELVSIAFAWSDTEAVTIPIHRQLQESNNEVREQKWKDALKEFFIKYAGQKVFHNYLFDAKFLVRHLFMDGPTDYIGRSNGARIMDSDDSMVIAYLCLNSTSRISLSLKELSYPYVGEYAVGVKDVLALEPSVLYEYNAMDVVATFWVYEKYYKMMIEEDQLETYNTIMQPSLNYLLNMMLSGLPLSKGNIDDAYVAINEVYENALNTLQANDYTQLAVRNLRFQAMEKYNGSHIKQKTMDDFDIEFNPNSPNQLRELLFEVMEYEAIEFTPTNQKKTDRASVMEFLSEEHLEERKEVLNSLIAVSQTGIILTTFLATFKDLWFDIGDEDLGRLYGNQRLGGTLSGRLSSNSPNFANMPSGSTYGKAIKGCFTAPEGFLFAGSDYAALEDRVGAQKTGDSNKRKEFLEGFDGHSLRAYAFFKEEIDEALGEELDVTDPASINRIKDELPKIRAKSKAPSFAMAYGSGASKIQALLKCSKAQAETVFQAYHELYSGTAKFAESAIRQASHDKFTIGAYGLKLRTPRINSKDKRIASSEGRTLNNMKIQSYGLLTNKAGIDFQARIERDGMVEDVILINQIHDALYMLIRNDAEVIKWANDNLIECMVADYIDDQVVKNEACLDIGHSWDVQHELPNNATVTWINSTINIADTRVPNTIVMDENKYQSTYKAGKGTKHVSPILNSLSEIMQWRHEISTT